MKWFRFYSEVIHDPKIQTLSAGLRWTWLSCLCLSNENEPRGTLPGLKEIAYALRVPQAKAQEHLRRLIDANLIDIDDSGVMRPHNWDGRQHKSDDVTERVRQFRERRNEPPGNVSGNVSGNVTVAPRARSDSDSDSDPALTSGRPEPPPAADRNGSHSPGEQEAIEAARTLFGPDAARTVAANGPDISRTLKGRFDCYLAALRKIHADQAKPGAQSVRDLHALALSVGKRFLRDGIPPDPVSVEARASPGLSPAEREAKTRKALGFAPTEAK